MSVPAGLFYTKEHEWVRGDGSRATIGITDHAQHALGDITFVELPKVGAVLKQFGRCAVVESVKAASDVYAPVSGTVVEINTALAQAPEKVNKAPYGDGWFAVIEMKDLTETNNLMKSIDYDSYIGEKAE